MKRFIVMALLLVAATFSIAGLGQSEELIVAIDQVTGDQWEAMADSFQQVHGAAVGFRSYSQSSLPTQILVESRRSSAQFHLAMIPESLAASLSRYLVDLSSFDSTLRSRGVVPVRAGGRGVGVSIPFAEGWLLGVVKWPANQQLAIEFLVATATGATSYSISGVREQGVLPNYGREKIALEIHNPKLDGSLEALIGAAQQTLGAITTQLMSALPSSARAALDGLASLYGIPFSSTTSNVTVVLESSPGRSNASNVAALSALGVSRSSIESTSTLIKLTVPLSQLSDIVGKLTGVAFIRPPYVPFPLGTTSQGVAAIGAAAFHTAGNRGGGVKIAVIDLGFSGLSQAQARGDLPYSINQNDLTGTGLTNGITHGTAVAEIVHDVAPDAQLYLIKIADEVDLDLAVTYCLNNGIDIINHSLGWYNTNFYDGTGTVADIARRAVAGGSLWVNAAGNEAESHWEGTFSDGNADGWLDQTISFYSGSGSQIVLFLTWNDWPQASSDYDLYLFDPASNLVASSTKHQTGTEEPTESIQTAASMSGTYTVRIQGTGSRKLELFNLYQSISPAIASSSILAPANVAEVIAVGAIAYSQYTTGPQQPYSSQGPTSDGRAKPDLCAPDNVATGTAPYTSFPGSSGAAPHAAGAAALLLSQNPTMSESALRTSLLSQTIPMGSANIYGYGRLYLQPPGPSNQPPTAFFSISPASGQPGDWFQFNASTSQDPDGSIVSYAWEFGDGASDTGITSYHAYSAAGVYTARLTVTDDDGATATITHTVSVSAPGNQPPTAAFTVSPTSGSPGTWFTFNAVGSQDPDGGIASYAWEFGDGASDTGITSYHAYSSAGVYTARLTVTDDDGATATTTHTVSVSAPSNQPPTAVFTVSPTSGFPGTWFTFDASESQDIDGSIVSYAWQFGDGVTDSGITAHHAYASAATFTVLLTVTDNDGASNSTTRTVVVQTAAMPDLSVQSVTFTPSNPTLGQALTFTIIVRNSGTASAGQFRVRLQGSASSTQTYVASLASGASRTVILSLPFTTNPETFTVTADDLGQVNESNESNNTRSATATAATVPVVAEAGGPYSGTVGTPVSFSGAGSSGPITAYSWSFGDGTSAQGSTVSHSYSVAGAYTVSLTVYGSGGLQSTDTALITVSPAAPALAVQLMLPKTTYEVDEVITITYTTNRTAYVYLCEATSDGRVVLLYPSWVEPSNPVGAGTHTIPGSAYVLRVSEPTGPETLYLFATTSPLPNFPTSFSYGFPVLSTNSTSFRNAVLTTMQTQFPSGEWAYDDASLLVTSPAPTTGTLRVLSTPSGASVRLDGSTIGTTPLDVSSVSPGTHTVQVSRSGYVTETRSATVSAGLMTTVNVTLTPIPTNQPPIASFAYSPTAPLAGETVQFDATGSSDPDGSIVSYSWNFGDGGTASGAVVTHTFATNGTYSVTLTVTDNEGASDTESKSFYVSLTGEGIPGRPDMGGQPGIYVWGDHRWHVTVNSDPSWTGPHPYRIVISTVPVEDFEQAVEGGAVPLAPFPPPLESNGYQRTFEGEITNGRIDFSFAVPTSTTLFLSLQLDIDSDGRLEESASFIYLGDRMVNPTSRIIPLIIGLPAGASPPLVPSMDYRLGRPMRPPAEDIDWITTIRALEG